MQLDPSPGLHANGADLTWARWGGGEGTYSTTVLGDSPAVYWRLDESGGTRALDSTANGRDGTYASGVLLNQPGAIGSNASADTSSGKVTQSSGTNLAFGGVSFSVESWTKRLATGTADTVVSQGTNGTHMGFHMGFKSTDKFSCGFTGTGYELDTTATYTDSAWHHWVCTYNAGSKTFKIYRDGNTTPVASGTVSGQYTGSGVVAVGDNKWGSAAFAGDVDEVAAYLSELSSTTVQAHYNAGVAPIPGFTRYEVHRSTVSGFTPSAATLVANVADQALQTYRDTTAKASTTFFYKARTVTAGGSYDSNQIQTDLPATGLATVVIQPGFVTTRASGTYIVGGSQAGTSNRGGLPTMVIDGSATTPARALLSFELRPVPSGVTVTNAQVQLYTYQPNANATVNVFGLTALFSEGAASWNNSAPSTPWQTAGGDKDATATDTVTDNSPVAHWDTWTVTGLVQQWVNGTHGQHGFLFKHQAETGAAQLQFLADFYARSVALRPRLTVTYQDPSATVVAPEAAINTPAGGSLVKGSSVALSAGAADDGRVTAVQFKLDGTSLGSALTTPTTAPNIYAATWDTTGVSRGAHQLTVVATDDAGSTTTSSAVSVTVANSNAPTVSVSTTGGPATYTVTATATDDFAVSRVDFFVGGNVFGSDSSSPYTATLNTLTFPVYDGTHAVTAKAFDADGNATTSTASSITVTNTTGTKYKGTISTSNVPVEMRYDPGAGAQDSAPITVALTNNSGQSWPTASIKLRYRWLNPDASELSNSGDISIGADLANGGTRNVSVTVQPPTLPASVLRGRFALRIDLYDTGCSCYFAGKGNLPFEQTVTATRVQLDELGLERYQHYDGSDLGSGFGASVNLFNGNLVVESTLSSEPGRGLDTVAELTYNSLENGSVSPVGNNWSVAVSGLTPFGLPLDIHPNAADTAAGRTTQWIGFTDGDGTYHRFHEERDRQLL